MMYGFGDINPAPDTINVMEELLIEHIIEVVSKFFTIPLITLSLLANAVHCCSLPLWLIFTLYSYCSVAAFYTDIFNIQISIRKIVPTSSKNFD